MTRANCPGLGLSPPQGLVRASLSLSQSHSAGRPPVASSVTVIQNLPVYGF
jgi:hypothetical protein